MPQTDKDQILSALKAYERNPSLNDKNAVLLTPQGGYFLYGNRFCEIAEYDLELFSDTLQIQSGSVPEPLLFCVFPDSFYVTGRRSCSPELVSLIFRIDLGEDEPLRGILLAKEQEAKLTLFSDIAVEELYRLARKPPTNHVRQATPPDGNLRQHAEALRRNDLHALTKLYLQGQRLKCLYDIMLSI